MLAGARDTGAAFQMDRAAPRRRAGRRHAQVSAPEQRARAGNERGGVAQEVVVVVRHQPPTRLAWRQRRRSEPGYRGAHAARPAAAAGRGDG